MQPHVIFNPQAGSAGERRALERALKRLGPHTIRTTARPDDARTYAVRALNDGAELVIAAGGDGTINEVVNGLASNFGQARLGIIPLGTGNDFVRTINIPNALEQAIDVVLADQIKQVDVVRVCSDRARYFINVSAGGFSGLVDEKLTDDLKQRWGPLAYLRSAAEAIPALQSFRATLRFENEADQTFDVYNVIVANARYVAGGIPIAPDADPHDGLIDVLLIRAATLAQMALLVPKILLGQHMHDDQIVRRRVSTLRIDSEPRMSFNADGELVGNEPSTFDVLPDALQVIVGSDR